MTSQPFRRARTAEHLRLAVVLVAIIASTSILVVRSEAAFTAQTQNESSLRAGLVKLTDNTVGTAMFDVPAMVPDEVEQRCVRVVYGGTVPDEKLRAVRLHASNPGDLGPYLVTGVEMSDQGSETFSADEDGCAGFEAGNVTQLYNDGSTSNDALHLQHLTQTHGTYASAINTGWAPEARDDARWFRVTFRLADDNAAQDLLSTPTFTWELQSQLAN